MGIIQKLRYTEYQNKLNRDKAILRMAGYVATGVGHYWYKHGEIHLSIYKNTNGNWEAITPYEETDQLCETLNKEYIPNGDNPET